MRREAASEWTDEETATTYTHSRYYVEDVLKASRRPAEDRPKADCEEAGRRPAEGRLEAGRRPAEGRLRRQVAETPKEIKRKYRKTLQWHQFENHFQRKIGANVEHVKKANPRHPRHYERRHPECVENAINLRVEMQRRKWWQMTRPTPQNSLLWNYHSHTMLKKVCNSSEINTFWWSYT